jgi:23S rRNA (adenine2503-C2)-methyltransferase
MFLNMNKFESKNKNVIKYVFSSEDEIAEAVLYKYPDYETRTVLCCSTQSGCPVGCVFCGTGKRFIKNLTASEIIVQVTKVFYERKIDPSQIEKLQLMFMSMGEPFLNFSNVREALFSLNFLFPKAQLLISTVAPFEMKEHFKDFISISQRFPVGLQFSVHESDDERRNKLIPFKNKLNLVQISEIGELWYKEVGRKPFVNYCVHKENNTEKDASRLIDLFNPDKWEFTLSVICEREENIPRKEQYNICQDFSKLLLKKNASVRVFDPAGQDDIGGGCGQLWYVQKWLKKKEVTV